MLIADAAIAAAEALTAALHSNISSPSMDQLLDPSQATLKRLSTIFELPSNNDDKGSPRVETPSPRVPPPPRVETMEGPISSRTRSAAAAISKQEGNEFMQQCWASSVAHPVTGAPMEYRQPLTKDAWQLLAANEFGRLAQGVGGRIKGTNTITFIHHSELTPGRQPTYPRFVCMERPHKTEPNRTRLTLGGNLVDYPGDISVGTAEMDTIKMLLNSVVSTPGAEFCMPDITNFYLNTPMERSEYFKTHISLIPDEIIKEYNLHKLVDSKGYVLKRVDKGMYGLPQAGMLANKLLKERLGPHGYLACTHTPGLWRHRERPIMFTLIVDDFGIQHVGKQHAQHLIAVLKQDYEAVTTDWEGKLCCGITLDWDYKARTVNLSMPGYVERALQEFQHVQPTKLEHQPHRKNEPQYGAKVQLTDPIDTSAPLDKEGNLNLQQLTGKFLYYARAVDPTMLVTLSALSSQQTKGTEQMANDAVKFLNYCATIPIQPSIQKSDMILRCHSDASYLSESKAKHHQQMQPIYLHIKDKVATNAAIANALLVLQGCVKPALMAGQTCTNYRGPDRAYNDASQQESATR